MDIRIADYQDYQNYIMAKTRERIEELERETYKAIIENFIKAKKKREQK